MQGEGFKQIVAWQKGYQLSLDVYKATSGFPTSETYGLVSQMRRAAVAVPANIAEGYNRQHRKEYLQFLSVANGSLAELETYLLLARDLGYLKPETFDGLSQLHKNVARIMHGLLKSLRSPDPIPLTLDP